MEASYCGCQICGSFSNLEKELKIRVRLINTISGIENVLKRIYTCGRAYRHYMPGYLDTKENIISESAMRKSVKNGECLTFPDAALKISRDVKEKGFGSLESIRSSLTREASAFRPS